MSRVLGYLIILAVVVTPVGLSAKPGKGHPHWGHGRSGKVKFFEGRCVVEQKYKKDGRFEERRKCQY